VSSAIFTRSDGIPLHVEEFLATVGPAAALPDELRNSNRPVDLPETVSAHVEHILTKLTASRRAQITTWAATHRRPMSTDRGTSKGL
jgi:hypothetical protein